MHVHVLATAHEHVYIYIYNHGVASIDNLQVEVVCAVNGLVHLTASEYIPGP